ncbi:MAG: hypothetical protein D6765_12110 [Bacteroidetes bacterium]|nr:MAG: hypothetical protein D6765_12110 [Bacteroidota bacterium]
MSGLPLPKPLRRWLLGTLSNQERKAQDWLQSKLEENLRLLLEAKRQLRKLAEPPNRPFLRAGDLATWIARDIAYWQHPDGRQLNSEEYGELQAALAFFGREGAEQVYELFEKLELVGQPNRDHPFLFRLKNRMCPARSRKRQPKPIRGILEFYIAYLRAREKFLTRLQGRLKSGSNPTPEMEHWIPPLRSRSLPPRMNERAVVLPRGLFRRRFVELLPPPDGSPADTPLEQLTLMKLLEPYLDTPQAFYRYERRYARNEHQYTTDGCNLSELIPQIENEATQGSEEEDPDFRRKDLLCLARTINDTERRLRRYQLQDRLLWMIVRQELEREKNMNLQGWTLENVGFDQPDSPLKQEITFQLEYPLEGRNEPIRIEAKLRPRHYGKMRRTLHDRRLPGLLQWLNTESVDWERLQQELTKTITRQDEVLQLIFELEKAVHSRFEKECTAKKNRDYLKHRNYLEVLREHQILRSDEEFEHLLNLRNRFAHNEVPSPAELPLWKDERPGNGNLMEWLIEKSLQLYRDLLERVQGKGD